MDPSTSPDRGSQTEPQVATAPDPLQAVALLVTEARQQRESLERAYASIEADRQAALAEQRKHHRWSLLLRFMFFGTPLILGLMWFAFTLVTTGVRFGPYADVVGVVRISGPISSSKLASADNVIPALNKAFAHPRVKAVVVAIDSPGGSPVEAERISAAIDALRARHPKPVLGVIENIGASAAYLIAVHTDEVVAGRYSLVGSIGAVMSSWDLHRVAERLEVAQRVYASGHLKAMLHPFLPMTAEADEKARSLVSGLGLAFVEEVRQARGEKLRSGFEYGTGEAWTGSEALALGLVDRLGTLDAEIASRFGLRPFDFGPRRQKSLFGSGVEALVDALADRLVGLAEPSLR